MIIKIVQGEMMKSGIGNRLAELRKQEGLSQEEFAEIMGVSRQTICNWENGLYRPREACLQKMCSLFGVEMTYFYKDPPLHIGKEAAAASLGKVASALSMEQALSMQTSGPTRRRVAFWLAFGLLALVVVAVSVILILAYFPYGYPEESVITFVAWNFTRESIFVIIVITVLIGLSLFACLAWRLIKKYGLDPQKKQKCQAKLDKCQAKLGGQTADETIQSEEKKRCRG